MRLTSAYNAPAVVAPAAEAMELVRMVVEKEGDGGNEDEDVRGLCELLLKNPNVLFFFCVHWKLVNVSRKRRNKRRGG